MPERSFTIGDLRDAEHDGWERVDIHVRQVLEDLGGGSSNSAILGHAYRRYYALAIEGDGVGITEAHTEALMAVSIVTELVVHATEEGKPRI